MWPFKKEQVIKSKCEIDKEIYNSSINNLIDKYCLNLVDYMPNYFTHIQYHGVVNDISFASDKYLAIGFYYKWILGYISDYDESCYNRVDNEFGMHSLWKYSKHYISPIIIDFIDNPEIFNANFDIIIQQLPELGKQYASDLNKFGLDEYNSLMLERKEKENKCKSYEEANILISKLK